ncbi:P-loop containing nucleoside triphosphate hydrolase protein [Amylocarpus encephaloides]|uniref:P-loop containing nucleoside triphosphate hydrolase protein n=1 Tax=Amylocarpus encephaloides TaxID=45428 RepID=A0A9P8C5V5_9HELO|nr:P-loop containing nucleoside triphosphate hydrolase protein [Amylocarpus encephaloides]
MGLRDIFRKKADRKKAGEAATTEEADIVADESPDDIPFGLDVWVEGVDPIVDIVAIHGLNGHRGKTWTAKNKVNWLQDTNMLSAIIPNARIMSWGYDANTHNTKELSAMYLYDHAQKLVSDLSLHRRGDQTDARPIIFVAHSLGGIVLKSALIHSDSTRSGHLYHHKSIKTSTYGIMFMGTPHQGGEGVAWGKRLVNVASIFVKTNDKLLNILERDSEILQQQLAQYNSISGDFETKFAYETKPMPLALGKAMIVVPKSSAVVPGQVDAEPIAIMDHHINMVKFATQNDEFKRVASHLKLMVDNAPKKAQKNWLAERGVEAARIGHLEVNFNVDFDLTGIPKTSAFIGRKSDLDSMEKQLMRREGLDRRKICIIHGLGGVGKTQSAVEYARLHKDLYTSFFWIDGRTEETVIQSLLDLASRLPNSQMPGIDTQKTKGLEESRVATQEVLKWFALKGNTQWLLVFDNIDRTSYEEESTQQNGISSYDITQYFPRSDTGSIIITTRLQRLVSLGHSVHLRKLSTLDSLLILENHARRSLKRSSRQVPSEDLSETEYWDPDAVTLVKRLGCLPLALVFAGSYISKTTIVKYLELYDMSWQELHGQMRKQPDYPGRGITTTWQISFDEVERRDIRAAKLLRLWGYLDHQELWYRLLRWPTSAQAAPNWPQQITSTEVSFLAIVDTLLDFSVIEKNDNSETYSMHVVVHEWIKASFDRRKDDGLLQMAITSIGLAVPESNAKDAPIIQRRLLPHLSQLLQYWSHVTDDQDCINETVKLAEAEQMYQRALQGKEKAWGPEHMSTLETVNNLGNLYLNQGKLVEAEQMYQRALQGKEKAWGPEHMSTLDTVHNLGLLYANQGKLVEAEQMYQRALQGQEKAWGPEHTSTLDLSMELKSKDS